MAHRQKSQRTPFRPILNINTATRKQYTMIDQPLKLTPEVQLLQGRVLLQSPSQRCSTSIANMIA
jgi:hypothetical protein